MDLALHECHSVQIECLPFVACPPELLGKKNRHNEKALEVQTLGAL